MKRLKPRVAAAFVHAADKLLEVDESYRNLKTDGEPIPDATMHRVVANYSDALNRVIGIIEGTGLSAVQYAGRVFVATRFAAQNTHMEGDVFLEDRIVVLPLNRVGRIE